MNFKYWIYFYSFRLGSNLVVSIFLSLFFSTLGFAGVDGAHLIRRIERPLTDEGYAHTAIKAMEADKTGQERFLINFCTNKSLLEAQEFAVAPALTNALVIQGIKLERIFLSVTAKCALSQKQPIVTELWAFESSADFFPTDEIYPACKVRTDRFEFKNWNEYKKKLKNIKVALQRPKFDNQLVTIVGEYWKPPPRILVSRLNYARREFPKKEFKNILVKLSRVPNTDLYPEELISNFPIIRISWILNECEKGPY